MEWRPRVIAAESRLVSKDGDAKGERLSMKSLFLVSGFMAVILWGLYAFFTCGVLALTGHNHPPRAAAPALSHGPIVVQMSASDSKPNLSKAIAVVWRSQWNMVADPPRIQWVEGDDLNCDDGDGWLETNANASGHVGCVSGTFDPDRFLVRVAWRHWTRKFSDTSLTHELAHARRWVDTRELEYSHAGFDWVRNGRVDQANEALHFYGF